MKYYHEDVSVNQKIQLFVFTMEEVNSRMMGVTECRFHDELEQLKNYIPGQVADRLGKGFEQYESKLQTVNYVSLWRSDKVGVELAGRAIFLNQSSASLSYINNLHQFL